MPFQPGSSQKVVSQNISEFHKGDRYAQMKGKYGKAKADKIAVAAALSNARRSKDKGAKALSHFKAK